MVVFAMSRLLLLILLASALSSTDHVSSQSLDGIDDVQILEELEDLLLRDENKKAYSHQAKKRTPDGLLNQFNCAKQPPISKRKLMRFLKKLENGHSFAKICKISEEDFKKQIEDKYAVPEGRRLGPSCEITTPYRTIDGTCNNLNLPEQGAAGSLLIRVVNNAYDDGLSAPRTLSVNGGALPNARDISRKVFGNFSKVEGDLTALVAHFGQLLDHDVTAVHSEDTDCSDCAVTGECFSIIIDASDPEFGGEQDPHCFTFRRSQFETDSSGVRQHINSITSYLDASFVYGSDATTADSLVDHDTGLLEHLMDKDTGRDLLPPDEDLSGCAGVDEEADIFCGLAGDSRAAEQPGLTSLHTLFLREHNRIVRRLRALAPTLSADELYQKARKLLSAEWQHIVYNEYVPLMVGEELYQSKKLSPGAPYEYDPEVDASIANVFAAAAFRVGHTQVPFTITRANRTYGGNVIPAIDLNEAFFNATYIFGETIDDGAVDSILRGMTVQSLQGVDRNFADAVTDNLFGDPEVKGDGFDLPSLNIQRARDHGIPSYPTIREDFCGLNEINSFKDLRAEDIMSGMDISRLRDAYGKNGARNIDPFVGFLLEKHLPNALVGPTLACIFADQFHRLKFGDRFFYQNPDQFTKAQMDEIKKASLARLMCDNVEAVRRIQPYLFIKPRNFRPRSSEGGDGYNSSFYEYSKSGAWPHEKATTLYGLDNRRVRCSSEDIPAVDLSKFI